MKSKRAGHNRQMAHASEYPKSQVQALTLEKLKDLLRESLVELNVERIVRVERVLPPGEAALRTYTSWWSPEDLAGSLADVLLPLLNSPGNAKDRQWS